MPQPTPSQTIGPFFIEALKWAVELAVTPSDGVRVSGRVLDRDGQGVSDALLEIWQPDWPGGQPLAGLQRVATDDQGRFGFFMPKARAGQVHANVTVFARGLLCGLFTRVYLHPSEDAAALELPAGVPAERRATLLARRADDGYRWDIRLQGEAETVFFEV
jgi:protocatechuate 3,4-dioxygenase alpha subunit